MNTTVEQRLFGPAAQAAYQSSLESLRALESLLSFYQKASEVSLINRNAGKAPVRVSRETMQVLEEAQRIAALSRGAFSIMLAPLIQLWRKAGISDVLPTPREIDRAKALCKRENLILDAAGYTAFLTQKGSLLDLGGIAKGFAADSCCELYNDKGVTSAFINLGGNVKTLGSRPDGTSWTVGLQHPDRPRGNCFAALECSNHSVVSAGAYERYKDIQGARYHHILDGRTGMPAESGLKSVTVTAASSLQADALSTAAFVLGLEEGIELIYRSEATGAVFMTAADKVYVTKGIRPQLKLFEPLPCYQV
ncbi:MAG: FAD:protein FMN transferase [Coriobacteriia bacterium]|nr:FAD:protein FMN transferase [Coriobacteriia bacterium]